MKRQSFLPYIAAGAASAIVFGSLPYLSSSTQAAPRLLPFQGRLTDANGTPVADGARVVQFKIYDAPTGGAAVWNGEVQKVTVNGGLVSTLLGSKADLSSVDFNQTLYLEITVDANADNQITVADPPLLPRQSILPAVFAVEAQSARDSQKLGGFDWNAVFDNGNPATGKISGAKLADVSVTATQLAPNSVTTAKLAAGSIDGTKLAADAVSSTNLVTGAVTSAKVADGAIVEADLNTSVQQSLVPAGSIMAFGGAGPTPSGWLFCDGSALKSADYPRLHSAIGTQWGNGTEASPGALSQPVAGQTNFNLPDLRGYFLRGRDGGTGRDPEWNTGRVPALLAGGATGNFVGSFQQDALQGHYHQVFRYGNNLAAGGFLNGAETNGSTQVSVTTANGIAKAPVSDGSNGTPRVSSESRPKNAYVNYIIKL